MPLTWTLCYQYSSTYCIQNYRSKSPRNLQTCYTTFLHPSTGMSSTPCWRISSERTLEYAVETTDGSWPRSQNVSSLAKASILSALSHFQPTSDILAHTLLFRNLYGLIESSDRDGIEWTCCILCKITRHYSPAFATEDQIHSKIVSALISVLRFVTCQARHFSDKIHLCRRSDISRKAIQHTVDAFSPAFGSGAREIVEANALPFLVDLQRFSDPQILYPTYKTLHIIYILRDPPITEAG